MASVGELLKVCVVSSDRGCSSSNNDSKITEKMWKSLVMKKSRLELPMMRIRKSITKNLMKMSVIFINVRIFVYFFGHT